MNIYLDIDGVLIDFDGNPALHVDEFVKACLDSSAKLHWLSTWCKTNSGPAIRHLAQAGMNPRTTHLLDKYCQATNWDALKTDGIDFTEPFLWFDDQVFDAEIAVLTAHKALESWVKIDLRANPGILRDLVPFINPGLAGK